MLTSALRLPAAQVLLDWCSSGRRARGEAWAFASYESRTEARPACHPAPATSRGDVACADTLLPRRCCCSARQAAPPARCWWTPCGCSALPRRRCRSAWAARTWWACSFSPGPGAPRLPCQRNATTSPDAPWADVPAGRARRVAAHAAALLRDLESFTPVCFSRGRAAGLAAAGASAGAPPPPPFFFAAGCALEGAHRATRARCRAAADARRCTAQAARAARSSGSRQSRQTTPTPGRARRWCPA